MESRIALPKQIVAPPRREARIAGVLYLVNIGAGAFAYGYIRTSLVVPGDPKGTAAYIMANEFLYRIGFVALIVVMLSNLPLALIFYDLFKAVHRAAAALVALFMLVATAIEAINVLCFYAPLIFLSGPHAGHAGPAAMLQHGMAYALLELQSIGFDIAVVFFAVYDLLVGYLIFRSTFIPRWVGILMAVAGVSYLTNSFATFLAPQSASSLMPYILIPAGVGELAFCLWLLVMSVDAERWAAVATAAGPE